MSVIRWLFLCSLYYSGSALSAVNCNSVFPGPAQSFSAYSSAKSKSLESGTLYMQAGAAIKNYAGNNLCFENVKGYDSEMSNAACADGSSKCNITGVHSSALKTPSFPTNSDSNNSYVIADWGYKKPVLGTTMSLGKYNTATGNWDVGALTINDGSGNGSLYFSNDYKSYVISSITFNNNGKMILNAGSTYYILGDLNLNSGLISITGDNTKTTNIYINGSLTVNNSSTLTSNGRLLVYVSSNLNINGSNSTIGGSYYVNGDAVFWDSSILNGVISAKSLTLGGSSRINYAADTTQSSQNGNINHYEIHYPASQIACEPATITINACTNSDTSSCTKDTAASSSVTLSAPASGWSSNPLTLTNGTATVTLSHYTAENVKLGLSGAAYTCFKNGDVDNTCELPFISSALSFDIPTFTAGGNSDNVTLKAIKSDGSGTCSALLSGSQPISFTNSYVTPTTDSDLPQIINSSTAAISTISNNTSVALTFDNNGIATFKLAYNNAGVLKIAAQYTKANTDTGIGTLTVSGSDTVAVIPAVIRVKPADAAAICSNTTYANCSKYKTVGDNFTLNAEAGYGSDTAWKKTSNFFTNQMSSLPVLQHQLVAPAPPAGTLPVLVATSLNFTGGTASVSLSESDVGVYQYGVTDFVPYPNYQNESPQKTVPLSWSDAIGRFVPAKLKTTLVSHGAFTTENCKAHAALTSLGYAGQELQFAALPMFSVVATDSNGNALQNYRDNFAKITAANPTIAGSGVFTPSLVAKDNTALIAAATWTAGSWFSAGNSHTYSFGDDRFIFAKTTNHVNPFTTVLTLNALEDSDGVVAISSVSPFYFYPWAADNSSAFNVYDGRLVLNSVNGAENAALTMPFYMQYWNGSAYSLNIADNCSLLNTTYLQMNDVSNWAGIILRTSSAISGSTTTTATLSPATVTQGAGAIQFSAPNSTGWVDLSASASLPLWMQDLSFSSGLTPARASFGYYRGNDRLIYRREVFGGQ